MALKSEEIAKNEVRINLWNGSGLRVKDKWGEIVIFKEITTFVLRNASSYESSIGLKRQKDNLTIDRVINWEWPIEKVDRRPQ